MTVYGTWYGTQTGTCRVTVSVTGLHLTVGTTTTATAFVAARVRARDNRNHRSRRNLLCHVTKLRLDDLVRPCDGNRLRDTFGNKASNLLIDYLVRAVSLIDRLLDGLGHWNGPVALCHHGGRLADEMTDNLLVDRLLLRN